MRDPDKECSYCNDNGERDINAWLHEGKIIPVPCKLCGKVENRDPITLIHLPTEKYTVANMPQTRLLRYWIGLARGITTKRGETVEDKVISRYGDGGWYLASGYANAYLYSDPEYINNERTYLLGKFASYKLFAVEVACRLCFCDKCNDAASRDVHSRSSSRTPSRIGYSPLKAPHCINPVKARKRLEEERERREEDRIYAANEARLRRLSIPEPKSLRDLEWDLARVPFYEPYMGDANRIAAYYGERIPFPYFRKRSR